MNCGWVFQLFSAKCCFYQQILPFCSLQEINIAFWVTQRTDCLPQRLPYFSLGKGNGHNSCICASNTALLFTLFIPSGYLLRDALSCFPLILTRTLWDRMETVVLPFHHATPGRNEGLLLLRTVRPLATDICGFCCLQRFHEWTLCKWQGYIYCIPLIFNS